jgi:hypothetical protein
MSGSRRRRGVYPLPKARLIYLAVIACLVFAYLGAFAASFGRSLGMSDGDI